MDFENILYRVHNRASRACASVLTARVRSCPAHLPPGGPVVRPPIVVSESKGRCFHIASTGILQMRKLLEIFLLFATIATFGVFVMLHRAHVW